MFGNRAIYNDGWVAATTPPTPPWVSVVEGIDVIDDFKWELYNVAEDFSESVNLADSEPKRLEDMKRLFYIEAVKHQVLPIDNRKVERGDVSLRPSLTEGRNTFTYYDGMIRIPEGSAPDTKNKSWGVTAEIDVPEAGVDGVIITQGGRFSGWGLYLMDGKPVFHYNHCGVERYNIAGKEKLAPGKHKLVYDFKFDGGGPGTGGTATLAVDGTSIGTSKYPRTIGYRISLDETLDIGEDTGTPVSEDYKVPFKFSGEIEKVTIDLK